MKTNDNLRKIIRNEIRCLSIASETQNPMIYHLALKLWEKNREERRKIQND